MLALRLVLALIQKHRLRVVVLLVAYYVVFGVPKFMALVHIELIYLNQVILGPLVLSHWYVAHRLSDWLLFQELARLVVIARQLSTWLTMAQKLHRH